MKVIEKADLRASDCQAMFRANINAVKIDQIQFISGKASHFICQNDYSDKNEQTFPASDGFISCK
jgi:hypothetical protein